MSQNLGVPIDVEADGQLLTMFPPLGARNYSASFLDLTKVLAVALDIVSIGCGLSAALFIYGLCRNDWFNHEYLKLVGLLAQYSAAFVLFGRGQFLYRSGHSLLNIRQTAGVLRTSAFCVIVQSVSLLFSKVVAPRLFLVLSWFFITIFVILQKHLSRIWLAKLKSRGASVRNVLIVGTGSDARRVFSFLLNSPDLHLKPVAFFDGEADAKKIIYSHDYSFRDHAPVYTEALDSELLSQLSISDIYVADPNLSQERITDLQFLAAESSIELAFVGSAHPQLCGQTTNLTELDGLLVTSYALEGRASGVGYEFVKRLLDIAGALALLIVCSPILVCAALWVSLSSPGPVFFRQTRVGLRGQLFKMYKFRSMYADTPKYGRSPERGDDPRITTAGRFLRKTSLDELPQLLNVLIGDMSLVGPRPEMPYVVRQYSPQQAHRLSVKQGLTGLWQLSADRKHAIHDSIEYDLYYLEHRSFFLDMAILLHTGAFAMKGI